MSSISKELLQRELGDYEKNKAVELSKLKQCQTNVNAYEGAILAIGRLINELDAQEQEELSSGQPPTEKHE